MKRRIFLILFYLCSSFSVTLFAQDIEVKKFELMEKDQTAVMSPRKDINGNDCALIIVRTLKKGMEFEGWVVGDVEYKDDAYYVYMANGAKHLKLKHPNCRTKDIIFGEYRINSLKSKETYILNLVDDVSDIVNKVYSQGWNLNKMEVPDKVKSLIRMSATRGDTRAQIAMAQLSLDGYVKKQHGEVNSRGIVWIKKLLAAGDSTCLEYMPGELMYAYALQLIADAYYSGDISNDRSLGRVDITREKRIYSKVCEFEIKACLKGFSQAGNDLFVHYLKSNGLPQYCQDIIHCCKDSSMVGNINAIKCLGEIYEKGIGCKVDLFEAEKWYHQLYEMDSSQCNALCRIYGNKAYPIGEEHMSFIRNLSNEGNEEALFQLGCMYEEGRNVPIDEEKALELYNKSGNHKEALYRAAIILFKKKEFEEAQKKAIKLIHEEHENFSNLKCLSGIIMYNRVDTGIPFFEGNREEGLNILSTLAKQGHKEAKAFLNTINK